LTYLEIYNEIIKDLLNPETKNLVIVENVAKETVVIGLKEFEVKTFEDVKKYIEKGNSKKNVAATSNNFQSSRSHCVLQFKL